MKLVIDLKYELIINCMWEQRCAILIKKTARKYKQLLRARRRKAKLERDVWRYRDYIESVEKVEK